MIPHRAREQRMLELSHVFPASVDIGAPLELGVVATGRRRIVPILGGSVSGPRLTASILPGGADWQIIRADGTAEVVARYTLRADDGTLISVVNKGLRCGPPKSWAARLARGQHFRRDQRTSSHTGGDPGLHAVLIVRPGN
jgi:hypothetical protein